MILPLMCNTHVANIKYVIMFISPFFFFFFLKALISLFEESQFTNGIFPSFEYLLLLNNQPDINLRFTKESQDGFTVSTSSSTNSISCCTVRSTIEVLPT